MTEMERLNALKEDYLEHYGVKGQKWGITRSKEELGYDTRPKKKKTSFVQTFRQNRSKKKQAKLKAQAKIAAQKAKEALAKAEKEAAEQALKDAKTREKLKSVSNKNAEFIYKNRHLLDDKELETALKRINTENALKKIVDSKPSDFDKAMKAIKKVNGTMNDIYAVWDSPSMKAIRRMLDDDGKSDGSDKSKNEKKKK